VNPPSLIPTGPKFVVGIDPGVQGAIGVIGPDTRFELVHDIPSIGMGRKGEFDSDLIIEYARVISERYHRPLVRIEWPTTRPDESAESSKRFGVGLGLLWGVFRAAGCPIERVVPNKWKGRLGLQGKAGDARSARQQAVEYAELVIPGVELMCRGPRGGLLDGRAEALLIAFEHVSRTEAGLRAMDPHLREMRMLMGGRKRKK